MNCVKCPFLEECLVPKAITESDNYWTRTPLDPESGNFEKGTIPTKVSPQDGEENGCLFIKVKDIVLASSIFP